MRIYVFSASESRGSILIDNRLVLEFTSRNTNNKISDVVVPSDDIKGNLIHEDIIIHKKGFKRVVFYIDKERFDKILDEIKGIKAYLNSKNISPSSGVSDRWLKDTELFKLLLKVVEHPLIKERLKKSRALFDILY
jgi:hypothetical protein